MTGKNVSKQIKNSLEKVKTIKGEIKCLFLILLDTFCSYYLKR